MKRVAYILATLLIAILCSCQRRPLLDPEEHALLRVHMVTDGINNVTCNIYNQNIEHPTITSDMLRMIIYNADGSTVLSQGFLRDKGVDEQGYQTLSGAVMLQDGEYKILGYNFDISNTFITDESNYSSAKAYVPEISHGLYARFGTRAEESEVIYHEPEHIMVAKEPNLVLEPHIGEKVIDINAYPIVNTYYLQIRISGQQNMAPNAKGVAILTGLASERRLSADASDSSEPTSLYFELQKSTDYRIEDENKDVLCAVFNTFGKIESAESKLQITLSVLTRDGKTHQKVVDMNPIFATEDAKQRHWLLIDEVWDIPEPIVSGGGDAFTPVVDDWEDIEEVIPIGPR